MREKDIKDKFLWHVDEINDALNLSNSFPVGICLTDSNAMIISCNDKFVELSGYSREELIGKRIGKKDNILYSGYHPDSFYKEFWETIKANKTFKGIIRNLRKDGKLYWQEIIVSPYIKAEDNKMYFIAYVKDYSLNAASENFLERIINAIPGLIYVVDLNTKQNRFQSKNTKNILGYDENEFIDKTGVYEKYIHPDDVEMVYKYDELIKTFPNGETVDYEIRVKDASGGWRWMKIKETVFDRDKNGMPVEKIGVAIDNTLEKEQEYKLNKMENSIKKLLEDSKEIAKILTKEEYFGR